MSTKKSKPAPKPDPAAKPAPLPKDVHATFAIGIPGAATPPNTPPDTVTTGGDGWSCQTSTVNVKEAQLEARVKALTEILVKIADKNAGYVVRALVDKIGVGMLEDWQSALAVMKPRRVMVVRPEKREAKARKGRR